MTKGKKMTRGQKLFGIFLLFLSVVLMEVSSFLLIGRSGIILMTSIMSVLTIVFVLLSLTRIGRIKECNFVVSASGVCSAIACFAASFNNSWGIVFGALGIGWIIAALLWFISGLIPLWKNFEKQLSVKMTLRRLTH